MRITQKQYEEYKTALDMLTLVYKTGGDLDLGAKLINAQFELEVRETKSLYWLNDFYKEMRKLSEEER